MNLRTITKSQRRREALLEADDASTWKCETCDTIIEGGRYCWPCGSYWKDVSDGLFADDWEIIDRDMNERVMQHAYDDGDK